MFDITNIQKDVYSSLSAHSAMPVYFYPPKKPDINYIQIDAVKVVEGRRMGDGIAEIEVSIKVRSHDKSSQICLSAMDLICDLYRDRNIKFTNFVMNAVINIERTLFIDQEQYWVGEVIISFWLELTN